ncbi:hypothetical protein [Aeromonas hydrophila]|uniref:hypothetical protein n=1 Tax=Aeromonas hydrophila TaxID=644 RepID=UPI002B46CFA6|nr:hypothetical protein [Aeromonas hydrophila]
MTKPILAHGGQPFSHDLNHCPLCGSELQSGTDDRAFECPTCEYTEQEVAA